MFTSVLRTSAHCHCRCSVDKSWPTLCDRVECSGLGSPVLHYLLESAQTSIHWFRDASVSSSAALFSFCLQSFPASGSFLVSWLFTSGDCMRSPQSTWRYFIPWNSSSKRQPVHNLKPVALPFEGSFANAHPASGGLGWDPRCCTCNELPVMPLLGSAGVSFQDAEFRKVAFESHIEDMRKIQ